VAMASPTTVTTDMVTASPAMARVMTTMTRNVTTGAGGAGYPMAALGINQIARSLTSLNAIAALILPLLLTPLLLLPILLLLLSRILPRLLPPELLTTWLPT